MTSHFISGDSGSQISLTTNHFDLQTSSNFHLYQYHVTFSPEVPNRGMRNRLVREHSNLFGPVKTFDGMQLFLPKKLQQDVGDHFDF